MKKIILASVSAIALFGIAACSDNTDGTTTQSVQPNTVEPAAPPVENAAPADQMAPQGEQMTPEGGSTQPAPAQ